MCVCKLMKVRQGSSVLNQNVMSSYSTRDHDIVTIILLESDFFSQDLLVMYSTGGITSS